MSLIVTCQLLILQVFLGNIWGDFSKLILIINGLWYRDIIWYQWYHVYTGSHNIKLQKVFHKNRSHYLAQCEERILPQQFSQSAEASVNALKSEIMKFQFKCLLLGGSILNIIISLFYFLYEKRDNQYFFFSSVLVCPLSLLFCRSMMKWVSDHKKGWINLPGC